jgi:hypothetical protein
LCHTWLKIRATEVVHGPALRFHADVRVAFHHGARDVPGEDVGAAVNRFVEQDSGNSFKTSSLMMSLPMRSVSLKAALRRSSRFGTSRNRTFSLKHPDAIGNAVLPQRAAVQCPNSGI